MPGAKYLQWKPAFGKARGGDRVAAQLALAMGQLLKGLPETIRKMSSRALKEKLAVTPQ
jgi:hypothetical protein